MSRGIRPGREFSYWFDVEDGDHGSPAGWIINVPLDRKGSSEPVIVLKKVRRLSNINSVVLWLFSGGMTTRDIEADLEEVYGAACRGN